MKGLAVSVIVSSRNRPELLVDAVQSIIRGTVSPLEIVVVDQSDGDNTKVPPLGSPGQVRYIRSRTVGASRARNLGIRAATGEVLAFIDDDVVVHEDWLEKLVGAITAAGDRTVVTGRVLSRASGVERGFAPSTTEQTKSQVFSGRVRSDVLYTGNMALYRTIIDRVGLFDERLGPGTPFPAAEDNDFCLRLLQSGHSVLYVPDASVDHIAWRSEREFRTLRWNYGKGQGAYYAKHLSIRHPRSAVRLLRDITRPFLSSTLLFWRGDRFGGAFFSAGVAAGCLQWLMQHGAALRAHQTLMTPDPPHGR